MTSDEWLNFFEHPDVFAFCAKIAENPDDLAPKLVFADWLEENCPDTSFVEKYRSAITTKASIRNPIRPDDFDVQAKWEDSWSNLIELSKIGQFEVKLWQDLGTIKQLIRSGMVGAVTIPIDRLRQIDLPETLHSLNLKPDRPISYSELNFSHIRRIGFESEMFMMPDFTILEGGHLTNIDYLDLGNHRLPDNFILRLAWNPVLRSVKTLMLNQNRSSPAGMVAIANSPHVQNVRTLNYSMNTLDINSTRAILNSTNLPKLDTLFWVGMSIGNEEEICQVYREIANNPNTNRLKTFGLSTPYCPAICWNEFFVSPYFQNLTNFMGMGFYGADLKNESLKVFLNSPSFPKLEIIELSGSSIDDEGAIAIANAPRMQQISYLSFGIHSKITENGWRALLESPYLTPSAKASFEKSRVGQI